MAVLSYVLKKMPRHHHQENPQRSSSDAINIDEVDGDVSESLRDMEVPLGEHAMNLDSAREEQRRNSASFLHNQNTGAPNTGASTTNSAPRNVYNVEDVDISDEERKQRHNNNSREARCCYLVCCCNLRLAVIIVDIILILYSAVMWIPLVVNNTSVMQQLSVDVDDIDDDYVVEILDEHAKVYAIVNGVGTLAYTLPLYGAWVYEILHVLAGALWLLATLLANITISAVYNYYINDAYEATQFSLPWGYWIIMTFLTAVCMYPHIGLALALQQGTISNESDGDVCGRICGG